MKTLCLLIISLLLKANYLYCQSNPIAIDDTIIMVKNQIKNINLLANDIDTDGDKLEIMKISFDYFNEKERFVMYKYGDTLIEIVSNDYYYGEFHINYIICKKKNFQYRDTATFHLIIKNIPENPFDSININNICAGIEADGSLFWDRVTYLFRIPKESQNNAIFSAALWNGGYDDSNDLHIAAQTYRQQNSFDFFAGPIGDTYDSTYKLKYNKVWKLDKGMIADHTSNWGKSGYQTNETIKNWPGNGNVQNGEAEILAPFFDLNENGIYEPLYGDYPCILGDQTIYFLYNDDGQHTESDGRRMKIEIQGIAYAYKSHIEALNNSLFFNYIITNRSDNKYTNVYIAKWVDFDLGYAYDDMVGCDSASNAFYVYNDDFDENYGENPPAIGITFLSDQLSHFMYYNNDWSLKGNPSKDIHYYNYMTAVFKNNQQLRFGGDGFNNIWVDKNANFMFPDLPDKPFPAWNELSAGNTPSDRRGVGSIGPFTLNPGESKEINLAYVWARKSGFSNIQNVYAMLLDMKFVKEWFIKNPPDCYTTGSHISKNSIIDNTVDLFPNPVIESLLIHRPVSQITNYKIYIFDINGEILQTKSSEDEYTSIDFSYFPSGIYFLNIIDNNVSYIKKIIKL